MANIFTKSNQMSPQMSPLRTSGNSPLCPTGHRPFGAAALLSLHFFTGSLPAGHRVPLTMCDPWMTSYFLVADTQLYKRLCPSVGWSVRSSHSHCHAQDENAKNAYLGCCSWCCLCVSVLEKGWGEAGGWMPLLTRQQRYCDPVSLVFVHCR